MWVMVHHSTLGLANSNFLIIFTAALSVWIFRLVPESVPALMIILFTLVLDIKEEPVLLSGFTSDSFFLAASLFGIGFVLIKSRLFYRLSLYILYYLPPKQSLLQKVLFGIGVLMTPIISVQSARVTLMAPLLEDLLASSGIEPKSTTANALASSSFNGCILFSTIFLTGKSSNSVLYAMLPAQNPEASGWFFWLLAASFPGILLAALFFFMQCLFFKPQKNTIQLNKLRIRKELKNLNRLSYEEWTAVLSIITLFVGIYIASNYHFSNFWTCLAVYFVLFFNEAIGKNEFKKEINWTFLFYFGAIIGIMRHLQSTGIDLWLGAHLNWLIDLSNGNLILLIVIIYLVSWLCTLILGTMNAPALLFTVLLPITQPTGINNWIVAFTILMATESWVFPYQSSYYLCFEKLLAQRKNVQMNSLLCLNAWLVPIKLGIILLSIPFWYMLGIL
jgi:DASS family divalent anion:Na+ symporter